MRAFEIEGSAALTPHLARWGERVGLRSSPDLTSKIDGRISRRDRARSRQSHVDFPPRAKFPGILDGTQHQARRLFGQTERE